MLPHTTIIDLGYNFRMDDIRASIGCVQMRKLQADLEKRVRVRSKYIEELSKIGGLIVPFAVIQNLFQII